ncbi:hypothetical protein [uncultured Algibacter sp.]|uniref:hypothetical protein n=1 Tax=uncultured Algibacter sp. TaxID=298659 RepID=UPI0026089242|nr:hypothetical protein [uncultured Algibacter sp.]
MKKLIIIALALVSLQAIAQEGKKEKQNKPERAEKMMNLPAEDIATLKTKKMTLFLDLNESQQAKIQKINLENATKRKEMMAKRKAKKENGDAKRPTPEQRLKMENARLDYKIAMKAKMKTILNDEQYAKWEKAQIRKAKKGKEKIKAKKKGANKKY